MSGVRRHVVAVASAAAVAGSVSGIVSGAYSGATPAFADNGAPPPWPTSSLTGSPASSPTSSPAGQSADSSTDPAFGAVAGDLVGPFFDEIRVAAALSVEHSGPVPVTALEPGGGSSSRPTPWQPRADLRVPTAAPAPHGTVLSKDQVIWAAYTSAAAKEGSCHLPVMLLAAIGEVESATLRGRTLDARHDAVPPVVGPALSGGSFAAIPDTDHGVWDGDPVWDHAVGPMQFIPATWRLWGADGNGDGVKDPQNIEDAALAAAGYLCAGGRDLSRPADLQAAVPSYNHSAQYAATVLGIVQAVDSGQLAGP